MKFIHTSHLWWHDWFSLRVLKCRIVFLPPSPRPSSLNLPTHPPSRQLMDKASVCLVARCGVDEWKNNCNEWRVKSESAIFRLSISLQENKLTTNRRSRFRVAGWWEHSECQHRVTTLTRQWKARKGNFFLKGLTLQTPAVIRWGGQYLSAVTNEQTDRLMHNTALYNSWLWIWESPIIHYVLQNTTN